MVVFAVLSGIWIAEFGGPDAMHQCIQFARVTHADIVCKTYVKG